MVDVKYCKQCCYGDRFGSCDYMYITGESRLKSGKTGVDGKCPVYKKGAQIKDSVHDPYTARKRAIRSHSARRTAIKELFEKGATGADIAKQVGCSKGVVHKTLAELGLRRRKPRSNAKRYSVRDARTKQIIVEGFAADVMEKTTLNYGRLSELSRGVKSSSKYLVEVI